MSDETILSVKNLTVDFNEHAILSDVSFDVKKGEILVVIGPNGAGKTVLFKALLGLIPYRGEIKWQNNVRIGYVPQRFNTSRDFPLTTEEFMQLAPPKNNREALFRSLKLVGFSGDEHHLEHHILGRKLGLLSSGELQRVLIAAALLDKPDVLLFDEPTSGIDIGSEEAIYERLKKLNKEENFTMLLISHDLSVVHRWATNVLCLNKKEVCFGEPRVAITPDVFKELYGEEKSLYKHNHHEMA
ncbi:MAG: ABC transporter ATP-binding protein [Candidatus Tagabacteria bacterium CG_4_10_14_0_2_um_filter_40_13]|uniref:ABC transporter ATP-binding protein n=3 Tax=Candidatus Tagaibacteriota TaxID=1817918 RepID=A0A2M8G8F4_9BACT|nr:MAG: ABC transporter ATP-binding protein [Candidatus Tagabacteria bacterium CG11_big_fil_rev_8_21_14_0_20_41_11]PIU99481.1 MAG: ABC transporter ATP-binding protein [Candidatus Tagabacteria bacterium CG03_land_8_20_14_0_80_41_22]PIZ56575.1 MAG: ABC transporter ATP-binding protein [Candidatus Tagabacteria bacterium CG_4_10_14_0_2_um_filter_40_13]PJC25113.1 MAG: ABC transporter ATP-binding protein [Candidatus Tagabacteria bacterium CG_4_9_14_0_2_um_filter_41_11]PJC69646.1 MAG: ABC transporter A